MVSLFIFVTDQAGLLPESALADSIHSTLAITTNEDGTDQDLLQDSSGAGGGAPPPQVSTTTATTAAAAPSIPNIMGSPTISKNSPPVNKVTIISSFSTSIYLFI